MLTLHRRENHRRGPGHRLGSAWEKTTELEWLLKEPESSLAPESNTGCTTTSQNHGQAYSRCSIGGMLVGKGFLHVEGKNTNLRSHHPPDSVSLQT